MTSKGVTDRSGTTWRGQGVGLRVDIVSRVSVGFLAMATSMDWAEEPGIIGVLGPCRLAECKAVKSLR
jgi:hypothetical protein